MWLAGGCELIFGPRYLALAYGNLILTLILFFLVLHYAKKQFPLFLARLIALAIAVASSLPHGIIWYNSIALLLLSAIRGRSGKFRSKQPAWNMHAVSFQQVRRGDS